MTFKVADRVWETSATVGTGTLSLVGAQAGFDTFVAGIGDANTCFYVIDDGAGNWEKGIGTVTDATPDTLSRDTVLDSSNGGSAVSFTAGDKDVYAAHPAFLHQRLADRILAEGDDGGSADAYTLAIAPTPPSIPNGAIVIVNISAANTTATPVLDAGGEGDKTIVKGAASALAAGDLAEDHRAMFMRDLEADTWILINPATAGGGSSGISDVVDDTSPQLGGNLDVNGQSIVSASGGNIPITPDGAGKVVLDGLSWPTADGTADQYLKTDGSGNLGFATPSAGGSGVDQVARDMAAAAMMLANAAEVAGPKGAFRLADGFASDSLAIKTNAAYDSGSDWYSNAAGSYGSNINADGTFSTPDSLFSGSITALNDGNTGSEGPRIASGQSPALAIIDFGVGDDKTIAKYSLWPGTHDVANVTQLKLKGSATGSFSGEETDIDTWSTPGLSTGVEAAREVSNAVAYRYYALEITYSSGVPSFRELEFYEAGSVADMTLEPTAETLDTADPNDLLGYFLFDPVDSLTFGTDVVGKLSIDGGSTSSRSWEPRT